MTSNSDNDLVSLERVLASVGPLNLELLVVGEPGIPLVVVDSVVGEVSLVDSVETLDVGVSFDLDGVPVEGDGLICWGGGESVDSETVRVGVSESFGDGGGVPHDLREENRGGGREKEGRRVRAESKEGTRRLSSFEIEIIEDW